MKSIYSYRLIILVSIFIVSTSLTSLDVFAQGDVINACVSNQNGNLRIVTIPNDCRSYESPLSWNVQGPQGLEGPQGPEGPTGISGLENVTSIREVEDVSPGTHVFDFVSCPPEKIGLSGGCKCLERTEHGLFNCDDCALITSQLASNGITQQCLCANHGDSSLDMAVSAFITCAFVD